MHNELIDTLVHETNRYADQYIARATLGPESRVHRWKPTTAAEMKLFLAMSMLMGVIYKPSIEMYWSKSTLLATPGIASLMPRNRYCLILQFLHFNNNDSMPDKDSVDYDRLGKIRQVYDTITSAFTTAYIPGREVCIDEGMIRWFE